MTMLTKPVTIMPVARPITSDSHSNVYLVFMEVLTDRQWHMETTAVLMDHAGILEVGTHDSVVAIYELSANGQFRQVRVGNEPTLVHGNWNVTMLMQEHGIGERP